MNRKCTESSSAVTPEKNGTEPAEMASPTTNDSASHIVDDTEKWLGRSIIITGAPEPKK
jgi:hypothetical protein